MINRYDHPEISSIWDENAKFRHYLEVELALMEAWEGKLVPAGTSAEISSKVKINPERIREIEQTTKHDVIAFCTSITEQLTEDQAKYFHYGVTSSDIIDTATTLQIRKSMEFIIHKLNSLTDILKEKAEEYKTVICLGRSHGMYAEPMSFGQKFLVAWAEFNRRLQEYLLFHQYELTGQFSGAVGNYAVVTPEVEKKAIETLGLNLEPVSTQIIPRDRIAKLISLHSLIACAVERFCTEIRLLHHSDINELHEGFSKGQKGSSTMPHKKNPISAENLTGLCRMIRGHATIAMENTNLWHERDISHSSAERMMLPDSFGILYYVLNRLINTVTNLEIHKDVIENKVSQNFSYLSSYTLHELLKVNETHRDTLYAIVQEASFKAKNSDEFFKLIDDECKKKKLAPIQIKNIGLKAIKEIYLKHIDTVYQRTFQGK